MSHLARKNQSGTGTSLQRHLLCDGPTGHLLLPFRYRQTASGRQYWSLGPGSAVLLSGPIPPSSVDWTTGEAPPLQMTQQQVADRALLEMSGAWDQAQLTSLSASAGVVFGALSDNPSGDEYWTLSAGCSCFDALYTPSGWTICGVRELAASVTSYSRPTGAGAFWIGWQLHPPVTPSGHPDNLVFDGTAEVTGTGSMQLIPGALQATGLRVYAWVEDAMPPSGPYHNVNPFYQYEARFNASISFRLDVTQ